MEAACGDQKGPLSKERAYFQQSEAALESGQQVGRYTPVILKGLTEKMNQNKLKTGNLNKSHKQQQQQKNTLLRQFKEIKKKRRKRQELHSVGGIGETQDCIQLIY